MLAVLKRAALSSAVEVCWGASVFAGYYNMCLNTPRVSRITPTLFRSSCVLTAPLRKMMCVHDQIRNLIVHDPKKVYMHISARARAKAREGGRGAKHYIFPPICFRWDYVEDFLKDSAVCTGKSCWSGHARILRPDYPTGSRGALATPKNCFPHRSRLLSRPSSFSFSFLKPNGQFTLYPRLHMICCVYSASKVRMLRV